MRLIARTSLVFLCLLSAASAASAGMRPWAVELGAFEGSFDLSEDDTEDRTTSYVSGVRLGLLFSERHEAELVFDTVDFQLTGVDFGSLDSWSVRYLYNWNLGQHGAFVPYIGAGVGNVEDDVPGFVPDDDTQASVFGGMRVFAGPVFALRAEINFKTFSTFDVDQTAAEITAGLSWVVGGT